jgi:hypothetical protein
LLFGGFLYGFGGAIYSSMESAKITAGFLIPLIGIISKSIYKTIISFGQGGQNF